jgi:hypothetical protein
METSAEIQPKSTYGVGEVLMFSAQYPADFTKP